jgi:hypothetical protein
MFINENRERGNVNPLCFCWNLEKECKEATVQSKRREELQSERATEHPWSDVIGPGSSLPTWVKGGCSMEFKSDKIAVQSLEGANELFADVATGCSKWIHKPAVTAATAERNQGYSYGPGWTTCLFRHPSEPFYADSKAETEVHLTAEKPSATVEVRLGQKAGILEGRIIDVNTGAGIDARLVFYDQNGNQHFLMIKKGEYRALLPPGKDVSLMVSSPKYASRVAVARLQLESGQLVRLDIPLSKE